MPEVMALKGFEYPASQTIRNRIREAVKQGGPRVPMEDRGTIVDVKKGETVNVPQDVLANLLEREAVERVTTDGG